MRATMYSNKASSRRGDPHEQNLHFKQVLCDFFVFYTVCKGILLCTGRMYKVLLILVNRKRVQKPNDL